MSSIQDTLQTRSPYNPKHDILRTTYQKPWTYIPLISESWTYSSGNVGTFDNGGDELEIGDPPMPGFYGVQNGVGITNLNMIYTWRTIDISKNTEFVVWADSIVAGAGHYLSCIPIFSITDDHVGFRAVKNSFLTVGEEVGHLFTVLLTDQVAQTLDGIYGASPQVYDYGVFGTTATRGISLFPRPFPCFGRYMKLAFIIDIDGADYDSGNDYSIESIGELGVFVR